MALRDKVLGAFYISLMSVIYARSYTVTACGLLSIS